MSGPCVLGYLRLLLATSGVVEGSEEGGEQRRDGADHHEPKERVEANRILNVTGDNAGRHHAETKERRREGVMRRSEFSGGDLMHHVEHVANGTETPAELLDEDYGANDGYAVRSRLAQVNEREVRDVEREAEDKEGRPLEAGFGHEPTAQKRRDHECGCANGSVEIAEHLVAKAQSRESLDGFICGQARSGDDGLDLFRAEAALRDDEGRADLVEQSKPKPVEERKRDHQPNPLLLEEADERANKRGGGIRNGFRRVFGFGALW